MSEGKLYSIGIFLGAGMGFFLNKIMSIPDAAIAARAVELKAACEKPLPRTQHCVMAYVPEKQKKNP